MAFYSFTIGQSRGPYSPTILKNIFSLVLQIFPLPVLETTCFKQSTALRDHCSDATPLSKST